MLVARIYIEPLDADRDSLRPADSPGLLEGHA